MAGGQDQERDLVSDHNTPSPQRQRRPLTRRRLLQVAGGGAIAALGVTALYEELALVAPHLQRDAEPPPGGYPAGQYQVADYGVRVQPDAESAVMVSVPPLWNLVITATLAKAPGVREQQRLEAALRAVEAAYPYSPAGVFPLVAYGLPYFHAYIHPQVFEAHLPHMAETPDAGDAKGAPVLLDAIRFPSDPPAMVLEANDVVLHLRSDVLDHLLDVRRALFEGSGKLAGRPASSANVADLFQVTSTRTGFVGAGLPRRMAVQAGLKVASLIPDTAPLFMGFTSSQQAGQAKEVAVSFDGRPDPLVAPLTTARATDYFAGGTALHLSHLIEDLDGWYALSYDERLARMFHFGAPSSPGRVAVQTMWINPNTTELDAEQRSVIGHNEAVQRGSRTREGQALQLRVDFNTLDALDVEGNATAAPGVHFLAFTPGSPIFHRSRLGMDDPHLAAQHGVVAKANGINAFIRATRRQNFLVPPRAHRAFPLVELGE
jgi:hypothetical protein